ncbi:hypothetical protein [Sphingomonas sp.]|uniref:hypothetical protein n=1 Tax=Sphingomonas sp. TaxID=28214 RepID=UPI002C0651B7|nr:hypothetical protein [Sphingomonas sp.]HWK34797.1 hypothetical protein [Sphingomonas sp.]
MMADDGLKISRRGMVIAAGATAIAAAPAMGIIQQVTSPPYEAASFAQWRRRAGSVLRVLGEDGWVPITVAGVEQLANVGTRPRDLQRAFGFLVNFTTPAESAPAGNRTYEFSQGLTGGSLFLVRRADSADGAHFTAAFN